MNRTLRLILAAILALGFGTTILAQDPETLNKVRQAHYVASSPKVASLGLLHYSDLHGDDTSVKQLLSYISDYAPYIDAVINSGDAVHYYADATEAYPQDVKWWRGTGLAEKSLFVLGNHDGSIGSAAKGHREGSADWDFMGKAWDFDQYFSDYIEMLGYVMPEGYDDPSSPYYKSCFWHKDFESAKIRILGLDCIHFNESFRYVTGEQEEWLSARLAETLDPQSAVFGYSVIAVSHYPLDDFKGDNEYWDESAHRFVYNVNPKGGRVMDGRTVAVTNFHTYSTTAYTASKRFSLRNKVASQDAQYGYEAGPENPLGDIVQAWVDKGGKFVVWLSGHCHSDMLFYPERYPGLLCLAIDQAGNLRGNGISDREDGTESRVCANYYSVDTKNGLFKIVRLGLSMDRFLVGKDVLCYDYLNKKVIFE